MNYFSSKLELNNRKKVKMETEMFENEENPFETQPFFRQFISSVIERFEQGTTRQRVLFVGEIISTVCEESNNEINN